MSRGPLWCDFCTRATDSELNEDMTKRTYYCEAYPKGIPEAVFYAGHLYPKPGDNGIQFEAPKGIKLPDYLTHTQEEEDVNYRGYKEFYDEVAMSDEEFTEKMKREHGDDWHLYRKPTGDIIR